jgi:hypothetical protein
VIALALMKMLTTLASATVSRSLPTINGQVRPATFGNGDGSFITGGPDGTGRHYNLGHIRWVGWTSSRATGWGVGWTWRSCFNSQGRIPECSASYRPYVREGGRVSIRAWLPRHGVLTRVKNAGVCWRWWNGGGYFAVSCRTWRFGWQ